MTTATEYRDLAKSLAALAQDARSRAAQDTQRAAAWDKEASECEAAAARAGGVEDDRLRTTLRAIGNATADPMIKVMVNDALSR